MIASDPSDVLVMLNAPPELEEDVVDWLLSRGNGGGFTSFPVYGHSTSHDHLSAAEQVAGRQRRQQFLIQVPADAAEGFLRDAGNAFGVAEIRYSVLPIIACGHLAEDRR